MTEFEVLSPHLFGGNEENLENFSHDNRFSRLCLNLGPSEYEAGVLPT
jgi:hypothetical protein